MIDVRLNRHTEMITGKPWRLVIREKRQIIRVIGRNIAVVNMGRDRSSRTTALLTDVLASGDGLTPLLLA